MLVRLFRVWGGLSLSTETTTLVLRFGLTATCDVVFIGPSTKSMGFRYQSR